jgi:hypothetical protein
VAGRRAPRDRDAGADHAGPGQWWRRRWHRDVRPGGATTTLPASLPAPPAPLLSPIRQAISALALSPARVRPLGRGGPLARSGGSALRFTLAAPGRVTFTVHRLVRGRRVRGRCSTRARRGTRCTLARRVGSFFADGRAGANVLRFSGRVAGAALAPGSYRLTASVPGAASAAQAAFTIPRVT